MVEPSTLQLIKGRKYYDSILKELTYEGKDKNEHTFNYIFLNSKGNKIGLSSFEVMNLLTLTAIN